MAEQTQPPRKLPAVDNSASFDHYRAMQQGFRWQVDEFFNIADVCCSRWATQDATERIAIHVHQTGAGGRFHTYLELKRAADALSHVLASLGVKRGDRVLLMMGNELPLWELMLACIKLGAVMIPATMLLTPEDLRDRLERGGVKHVAVASEQAAKFADLPGRYTRITVGAAVPGWLRFEDSASAPTAFTPDGPTQATDPLLLYFTSGTTSKPKLVLHTHQSYPVGHLSTMYWIGLQPGDVHLNISSPGWAKHAWSCFFAPWNAGAAIFIYNYARFSAPALLGVLEKYKVNSLCAPPTVWRMLIQEDLAAWKDRLALREVIGAGEPLNPEIIDRVQDAWGLTLRDGFGQTETTAQIGNPPGLPVKAGSMGRPLPGYEVVLLDVDDNPAAEGELALNLALRPLGLMVCYEDSPEKTAEVMRQGCYRTGDTATRDADGYITFVGRADDVFKASDYRISPFELESCLIEHPAVTEVAIVPSPDPVRLAVPKAFVTLAPGQQPSPELAQAIFGFARERLAPYKRVRRLQFVTELPKTISGKIRRVQMRKQESERGEGARVQHEYFEDDFPSFRN